MPSRWQVRLPGLDPVRVTPEQLHGVMSGWFDTTEAAHHQHRKGYSVSPARAVAGGAVLEVGLVDDALVDRLHEGAELGRRLRFGSQYTVVDRDPCQVAGVPWSQLDLPSPATVWPLRFVSLTTFRRGNAFSPYPGLKPILGGLRHTWQTFAPPQLQPLILDLAEDPVWVRSIDVASRVVHVGGLVVSGFTGRMTLACDAAAETAGAVDRLLRLAPFAGVGGYTSRGFGTVRIETTPGQRVPPSPAGAPDAAVRAGAGAGVG